MMAGMDHPHAITPEWLAEAAAKAKLPAGEAEAAIHRAAAARVLELCASVADVGGERAAMVAVVSAALEAEPVSLRTLAALVTERCAEIAEQHAGVDIEPGADIRAAMQV